MAVTPITGQLLSPKYPDNRKSTGKIQEVSTHVH